MKTINTINKQYEVQNNTLIGRLEYYNFQGEMYDHTDYDDAEKFIEDVTDEMAWCDAPIAIVLYNGNYETDKKFGEFLHEVKDLVEIRVEDAPISINL